MRATVMLLALFLAALPARSETAAFSQSQRVLGPVVLRELSIKDGKLVFRVDSGGCTDKASFKVNVEKEAGISAAVLHYRLTIERVRIDDCKALLWDGVLIEMDLGKDLGLAGNYTVSVENPVLPRSGDSP